MELQDDIFAPLHINWRQRLSRTTKLIVPKVSYWKDTGQGSLNNDNWAYKVGYGFRDALDLAYTQRVKTINKERHISYEWTQGAMIHFKEGDLLERKGVGSWLQVVSGTPMGWDSGADEMFQGVVSYRKVPGDGELQTATQMEFLAMLVFGEEILQSDRLKDITEGADRFIRPYLLANNKDREKTLVARFIYMNQHGEITYRQAHSLTVTDNHIQAYCMNADAVRTFRKDRVLEWLKPDADIDARLAYHRSCHPDPEPRKKTDRVFKPAHLPDVCFTGFNKDDKNRLTKVAKENGLVVRSSVTKSLDILCCGYNAGPKKLQEAREKDTMILNEKEFIALATTGEIFSE